MKTAYLGEDLIFVISQPRSGSTLLQRVLSGHPEIQTSAETWLMLHPVYAMRPRSISAEYGAKNATTGVRDFLSYYTSGPQVYDDAIRAFAATLYGNALACSGKRYFLDKTPRYFFIIPDLQRLFPKARFVFLLRNPLAVLSSLLKTYVKEDWPALSFFRHDLLRAPSLIKAGIDMLGEHAIVVRYEDFVSDPESQVARLCDRLGLAFEPAMLEYARTAPPKGRLNDPVGVHRHSRPTTGSLNKWKSLADSAQARHFAAAYLNALGEDLMLALDYPVDEMRGLFPQSEGETCPRQAFPFGLALKPAGEWTFREWVRAERYFRIRKKGYPLGALSAWKRALFHGYRKLRQQCR